MVAADKRASELAAAVEERDSDLRSAQVELAVRREVAARRDSPFADVEVVLPLVRDAIETDEAGEPVGVAEAMASLAERHPYLLAEHAAPATRTDPSKHAPSGGPVGSRIQQRAGPTYDTKKLETKYPMLSYGRRRRP
ncbi:hypothetical protein [Egicoccus halophilus]|uniref:Uncharacterized protein n=1 Tax=Egicoccus halophilus TaxID=1670830 RepID=A0A8J3EVF6_9ACTN|nr:hypothetical protein [Egicoccus halophilus]GGI09042.1 hypothetical protein GCM10011354_32100 [Egicoccus halophilus]